MNWFKWKKYPRYCITPVKHGLFMVTVKEGWWRNWSRVYRKNKGQSVSGGVIVITSDYFLSKESAVEAVEEDRAHKEEPRLVREREAKALEIHRAKYPVEYL